MLAVFEHAFATDIPLNLKCLWSAYQSFKISSDANSIVFTDGKILPYATELPITLPVDRKDLKSINEMFLAPYVIGFTLDTSGHKKYQIPT